MEDLSALADDIGRLNKKFGRQAVIKHFQKQIGVNNREIPATGKMRALYNYYRALYPASVPISYSFLRSDVLLGETSEIKFHVNESDGNSIVTERRLNLNDTFEVVDLAIYLWTVPTTGDPPVPTAKFQQSKLYTYINPFIFAGATEASRMESIYNSGKIIFKLGNQILYDGIDCLRFLRIPTSQEGQITAATQNIAGDTPVVVGRIPRDGYSNAHYPFDDNIPALTLSGNGKNSYVLTLPESINLAPTAGQNRQNYISLWVRGFQCQNGAQQSNKKMTM